MITWIRKFKAISNLRKFETITADYKRKAQNFRPAPFREFEKPEIYIIEEKQVQQMLLICFYWAGKLSMNF